MKYDLGGIGVNRVGYYTIYNDQNPHGFAVTDSATCNMGCDEEELVKVDDAYKGRHASSPVFQHNIDAGSAWGDTSFLRLNSL